jgi:O-6-methylguanine DNA methyltransferase
MVWLYPARTVLPTPFGVALEIVSSGQAIVASDFVRKPPARGKRDALLREAAAQVHAYFRKQLARFDVPLALHGTAFQVDVWVFVSRLETGELISYSDLARGIGRPRAARGVARAMSQAPLDLFVPAHRVVGAGGTIRGAGRGSMRRKLLAFEGINWK